jgi:hypothetical protein
MMSIAYINTEPRFHQLLHISALRLMPTIKTVVVRVSDSVEVKCHVKMSQQNVRVSVPAVSGTPTVIIEMCSETGGIWRLVGMYDGSNPPDKVKSGHLTIYCEWKFGATLDEPVMSLVWQVRP